MSNYSSWWARLYIIEREIRPSSRYLGLLVFVAFVLGALSYSLWTDKAEPVQVTSMQPKIKQLKAEVANQTQQLANTRLALSLAQTAHDEMKKMFTQQHKEQVELARELAFYRSIMAPENSAQGVAIHGLELTGGMVTNSHKLKLVLTQLKKRKSHLKGTVSILLMGSQDGKEAELKLASLSKQTFSFRYFQVFETKFTLPDGFVLSRIQVKVNVPASRWSKADEAEQVFNVSDLQQLEKEQRVLLEQNSQVIDNSGS